MSNEIFEKLTPLNRTLRDPQGRVICQCRGSAKEVLECHLSCLRVKPTPQDPETIDYNGSSEIHAKDDAHHFNTHEMLQSMYSCSGEGIAEVSRNYHSPEADEEED